MMKKIISLALAVCLIATLFCSVSVTTSAATLIEDINVDLTKVFRVGTDDDVSVAYSFGEDGSMNVNVSNYKKLFMSGDTMSSGNLWLKGAIFSLMSENNSTTKTSINMTNGYRYSINVTYDVTSIGTQDTRFAPQIGLGYGKAAQADQGTTMLAAKKHTSVGTYTLSAQYKGSSTSQNLKLVFGGHGGFVIKSLTIKRLSQAIEASDTSKTIDLTLSQDIKVSGAKYSNFSAATATEPLKITVDGTTANQYMDSTNSWANTWHGSAYWIKTGLVSLKYADGSAFVLDETKAYQVVVNYKLTESSATEVGLYPEIAVVRNNGVDIAGDNGTFTLAATRINPNQVGKDLTYTSSIFTVKSKNNFPVRLGFAGKGSFEIYSVVVKEFSDYALVTLVNDGLSTSNYMVCDTALPTPVKEGYEFMGWFDANGKKHTTVKTNVTLTAAWTKTGNVDLTATDMIAGTKATMTLDVPTDASSALGVTIQGFEGILMNKENVVHTGTVYTGGAAVSLEYSNDSYVGLDSTAKYVVNVEYDVTNIGTYNKQYHPQIAILYNVNTLTQDNGQFICAAKKHSATVENASISCVISGTYAKALRLAFDGQGSFNIKSVTVTEIPAGVVGLNTVKYTDNTYSTDKTVIAENGSVVTATTRTFMHNFGGWFNADGERVTTVSGDIALTAKWFSKFDVNKDEKTNVKDLVRIKKSIADETTDLLFDIDRDDAVSANDTLALRKDILGIQPGAINSDNVATYAVTAGAQQSFMTAHATKSLVDAFDGLFGVDLQASAKTSAENKIVVGISNIDETVLKSSALENLIGVNGDVYGLNDYKIFFKGNDLYIEAGSDYATAFAVNKFIATVKTYGYVPENFKLSGTYNGEKAILDGYSYVWGDEFGGNALNTTNWKTDLEAKYKSNVCPAYNDDQMKSIFGVSDTQLIIAKSSGKLTVSGKTFTRKNFGSEDKKWNLWCEDANIKYNTAESYSVANGLLTMNAMATDDGYSVSKLMANHNFTYGIMEARIMLGSVEGASATFWARSKDKAYNIPVNEFDFVETFGAEKIKANLHTWENAGAVHTDHAIGSTVYPAEGEKFSDTFHHIAFVWTDKKVTFYLDGVEYLSQDITDGKWDAFREETFLILGLSVPNGEYLQYCENAIDYSNFSASQKVDYIRIYQVNNNFTLN